MRENSGRFHAIEVDGTNARQPMNACLLVDAFHHGQRLVHRTATNCDPVLDIRLAVREWVADFGGRRPVNPDIECEVQIEDGGVRFWHLAHVQTIHAVP